MKLVSLDSFSCFFIYLILIQNSNSVCPVITETEIPGFFFFQQTLFLSYDQELSCF